MNISDSEILLFLVTTPSGRVCSDREHSGEKVSGEFSSVGFVLGENIRGECEKGESSLKEEKS